VSAIPLVSANPEQWAAKVADIKQQLERNGRDPDDFTYGAFFLCAMHEDEELIAKDIRDRFKKMCEGYFDNVSKILVKDHLVGIDPFGGIEGGH